MRNGRWDRAGAPSAAPSFPPWPSWFDGPKDFGSLSEGLDDAGFSKADRDLVLGGNWMRLFGEVFPE
jgi:microsomal dipeptidase-like Zn-dependent dipeptidase